MRVMSALPFLPFLALAACNVDNDAGNDQVTLEYNESQIRDAASTAARTAKEVVTGVENVATSAGRAIHNEVGDIDVDVDVRRNRNRDNAGDGNTAEAGNSAN